MKGMALQWRTVSTNGAPTSVKQPHYGRASSRATVQVHASSSFLNPHSILGVSPTADVKEVKRAYRKLALQFHPDVCKREEGHERFIALTQAYEMLLGRAEGKTDTNYAASSGWDFHDWYWNFRMHRSWDKQQRQAKAAAAEADADADSADAAAAAAKGGGGEPAEPEYGGGGGTEPGCGGGRPPPNSHHAGFKQPEARENLRSQLAGLRHRAAVRANRPAQPPAAAAASAASGCALDPEDVGTRAAAAAAASPPDTVSAAAASAEAEAKPSAGGKSPIWSWTWSWDETLESENEQSDGGPVNAVGADSFGGAAAAASAELHNQYTHVYDAAAAVGAAAGGAAGGGSDVGRAAADGVWGLGRGGASMSVHDGHMGTVVANHAVPFPAGGFSSVGKQQQKQQPSQEERDAQQQQQQHQQQQHEEPEPEPFSNPFDGRPPPGQAHQQQQHSARRRFAADGAVREAVSHQLTGLRRKAAIKARGPWAPSE